MDRFVAWHLDCYTKILINGHQDDAGHCEELPNQVRYQYHETDKIVSKKYNS